MPDSEDLEVTEEENTEEATPQEETTEDESSEDVSELQALVRDLRARLDKVTKESIKRKAKIKDLTGEIDTLKTSGPDSKALADENAKLKSQLSTTSEKLRGFELGDRVAQVLKDKKITLVSSPTALKDLVKVVVPQVDNDWDEDDFATNLTDIVVKEVKERPYLTVQRQAPDLDQHRNGTNTNIPDTLIEDVARDFNLQVKE